MNFQEYVGTELNNLREVICPKIYLAAREFVGKFPPDTPLPKVFPVTDKSLSFVWSSPLTEAAIVLDFVSYKKRDSDFGWYWIEIRKYSESDEEELYVGGLCYSDLLSDLLTWVQEEEAAAEIAKMPPIERTCRGRT